jgi:hypothetical protein
MKTNQLVHALTQDGNEIEAVIVNNVEQSNILLPNDGTAIGTATQHGKANQIQIVVM